MPTSRLGYIQQKQGYWDSTFKNGYVAIGLGDRVCFMWRNDHYKLVYSGGKRMKRLHLSFATKQVIDVSQTASKWFKGVERCCWNHWCMVSKCFKHSVLFPVPILWSHPGFARPVACLWSSWPWRRWCQTVGRRCLFELELGSGSDSFKWFLFLLLFLLIQDCLQQSLLISLFNMKFMWSMAFGTLNFSKQKALSRANSSECGWILQTLVVLSNATYVIVCQCPDRRFGKDWENIFDIVFVRMHKMNIDSRSI